MDDTDRTVISHLRAEGRLTNQEVADRVGLTPAPCLRRVRRLEKDGVITGYAAQVDCSAVGEGFEVLMHVDLVAKDLPTVEAYESRERCFGLIHPESRRVRRQSPTHRVSGCS